VRNPQEMKEPGTSLSFRPATPPRSNPLQTLRRSSESLWLPISEGPLDLSGSDAVALLMLRPLLLYTSICLMDHGGLDRGRWHTLSYSLNVLLLCNASLCPHGIYCFCPSWRGILLCCSPDGFFPFFPHERFFSISWVFFLIRCEVLGQGCRMCPDCKALWGKCVFCDNGLYKIIWIELNQDQAPDLGWQGLLSTPPPPSVCFPLFLLPICPVCLFCLLYIFVFFYLSLSLVPMWSVFVNLEKRYISFYYYY